MALEKGAATIITGSFTNLSVVCEYLLKKKQHTILACSAWKDRVNIEDTLFAGAVIERVKDQFSINCDSSQIAEARGCQADYYGPATDRRPPASIAIL